jgi:drug/metabolite transporter (DMT)-like permease
LGDFSGGQAAKQANVFGVVVIADAVGLVLMIALALVRSEPLPSARGVLVAALAGLVGAVGLAAFYRALATGSMGVQAPFTALLSTVIPVLFGLITEGLPQRLQMAGFILALVSVSLISFSPSPDGTHHQFGLAALAGVGFAGFLILSKYAGTLGLFWILAHIRLASLVLMVGVHYVSARHWVPALAPLGLQCSAGIFDVLGNFFFLMATRSGRLDISAVLASMYPAVTVLIAVVVLRERFTLLQGLGIAAALGATLLLSF